MKSQENTKVTTIHHEGDLNVSTRFQGNPSNSYQDISLEIINLDLMVAREKVRGSPESLRLIVCAPLKSVKKCHLNLLVVEIFPSGPKWRPDQPTNQHCHP